MRREIEPGELVITGSSGRDGYKPLLRPNLTMAVFEDLCIFRPDSRILVGAVTRFIRLFDSQLAQGVWGIGETSMIQFRIQGVPAALGYSAGSGLPASSRTHSNPRYMERTFVELGAVRVRSLWGPRSKAERGSRGAPRTSESIGEPMTPPVHDGTTGRKIVKYRAMLPVPKSAYQASARRRSCLPAS